MSKKAESKGKKEICFGFPFGDPQAMKKMMKMRCRPGMEFCKRCPTGDDEKRSSERKANTE